MWPPFLLNITTQAVLYCLEMYSNWFLKFQALMCPLTSTNSIPTNDQYHKTDCIFLLGISIQLISKLPGIYLPLDENQCNPRYLFSITKQAVSYCLEIYSNLLLNFQSFICPLLNTNATPTPVQYHKTSCILMLWNVLQFIYKLPSIDEHLD